MIKKGKKTRVFVGKLTPKLENGILKFTFEKSEENASNDSLRAVSVARKTNRIRSIIVESRKIDDKVLELKFDI